MDQIRRIVIHGIIPPLTSLPPKWYTTEDTLIYGPELPNSDVSLRDRAYIDLSMRLDDHADFLIMLKRLTWKPSVYRP